MPLNPLPLDSRTYQQLLEETLARIPVHNREWTNFNPSDPGVTILELFAFLTESLLYRCNQIPDRNRRKFLSLLGVPLRPASSAQALVTFANERGSSQTITLNRDLEVVAGKVSFRTELGLDVLPLEARVYFKREQTTADPAAREYYDQLYASLRQTPTPPNLKIYETVPLSPTAGGAELAAGTIDHSLWIALLARPSDKNKDEVREQIGGRILSLGLVPVLADASRRMVPGGPLHPEGESLLKFELPVVPSSMRLPTDGSPRQAVYRPLDTSASSDLLARPSVVQITLPGKSELGYWNNFEPLEAGTGDFPPALDDSNLNDRLITWLRVRATPGVQAHLLWLGINATMVQQRGRVANEVLPLGSGEPDQIVKLARTPIIAESVALTITPVAGPPEQWTPIEDLLAADPEVPLPDPRQPPGTPPPQQSSQAAPRLNVFAVDPESGEIRFGDGARGRRPPLGATMRADYDYAQGREGNVGEGSINTGPALPAGLKVTNPVASWGGAEGETVAEGEKQIPRYLQHRDRLVSAADFEAITLRTPGVDLGRVEVLPAYSPELAGNEPGDAPGATTLLIIPQNDPINPDAPRPDKLCLDTICSWLEPRRLVTTEIFLRGPVYVPIWVSVGVNVVAGFSIAVVIAAVKLELRKFLSPLPADRSQLLEDNAPFLSAPQFADPQRGWPLRKSVVDRELMAVASRVRGVLSVSDVLLANEDGVSTDQIPMEGLQLPRLIGLSVVSGAPLSIDALRGLAPAGGQTPTGFVPVPVIPNEC